MKQTTDTAGAGIAPIQMIRVSDIVPDPKNEKRNDAPGIAILADSIKRDGLLQPIVVRKNPVPSAKAPWMIVAGERRWEAHKLLKRDTIESRVRPDDLSDVALGAARKRHAENFHREDLSPIQKARALQELFDLKMPQAEIAAFVGAKDQSTVSNFCRLLRLPAEVQDLVHSGRLSAAHAKALLKWEKWPKACCVIAQCAARDEIPAKQLEREDLPYTAQLKKAGVLAEFSVWEYDDNSFIATPEMRKDPDYVFDGSWRGYCLVPEKWEKEKVRQAPLIAERKKKRAAESKSRMGGAGTKLSASEKKEREKKVAQNKARRQATATVFAEALVALKNAKGIDLTALAVVCDRVLGEGDVIDFNEAAASIGLKLPNKVAMASPGWGESVDLLRSLGAETLIRLTASVIVQTECERALKFSSETPAVALAIAGKKKAGGANTVQVSVSLGNDNKARAGSATASCTSSPEDAAKKAASKFFQCSEDLIALDLTAAGSTTNGTPSLYIATRKGARK